MSVAKPKKEILQQGIGYKASDGHCSNTTGEKAQILRRELAVYDGLRAESPLRRNE